MPIHEEVNGSGATGAEGVPVEDILAALTPDPDRLVVRSEFAIVGLTVKEERSGRARLCIEDLRTQQTVELDPLELESLAWAQHEDLSPLLDPSRGRWANHNDE